MPQISKRPLRENVLEKLFDLFFELVGKKSNKKEFLSVLSDVLSPTERIMIAKRIAIMYLLTKNVDYRTICNLLNVSTATVCKFNLLLEKSRGVGTIYHGMIRNEKMKEFLEEVFLTIRGPMVPGVNWSSARKRLNELSKKKIQGL